MLKNCHLCKDWLRESLVKIQAFGSGTHPDFRLFITSEINPKLPTGLLRISDIIVAEAPTGVKASLSRFFSSISHERFQNSVRNRLYLLLGWIHAVIQERLRCFPAGWSERYEFTEADAIHALDVIDSLVEESAGGRQQLDPEKLPWDAIRSTLCMGVFGGRVTNPVDQEALDALVNSIFAKESFDVNFKLGQADEAPCLPDGTSKDECFEWIESLPAHSSPEVVGLDGSAEAAREQRVAESIVNKIGVVAEAQASQ
jgi:dynein heavy chain 1